MKKSFGLSVTQFFHYKKNIKRKLPLFKDSEIMFPSEEDIREKDLNEFVKNPETTFILKVTGDTMINEGIKSNDFLIVDKSIQPSEKSLVVVFINDECLVKRVRKRHNKFYFDSDNPKIRPIEIKEDMEFQIFGVITYVIHPVKE